LSALQFAQLFHSFLRQKSWAENEGRNAQIFHNFLRQKNWAENEGQNAQLYIELSLWKMLNFQLLRNRPEVGADDTIKMTELSND
jgi:hypothetical protein